MKKITNSCLPKIILLLILMVSLFTTCSDIKNTNNKSEPNLQNQPFGLIGETFIVRKTKAASNIEISGHLEPFESKVLSFAKNGRVEEVKVKVGDKVKKGTLLARLYSYDAEYNLKNIRNQIETKKLAGAARELELLLLQEKSALQNLEDCYLRAPFSGVIAEVFISSGDIVGSNNQAFKLIDISRYKATVEVDELDAILVKIGQKVQVTFDARPDKAFIGEVYDLPLEGKVNSQNIGVLEVIVIFSNLPTELKTGFSFSGQIIVDTEGEILIVPKNAVNRHNNKSFVLVASKESSNPERREITVSDYNSEYYKVESGLSEGEVIVLASTSANRGQRTSEIFFMPMGPEGGPPLQRGFRDR